MSRDQIAPAFLPALTHLEETLRRLRTGRATPGLVDQMTVQAYGSPMRLKELATITIPDAKTIQIEPWDASQMPSIVKALQASPLGLQPSEMGTIVCLTLPPLTEERRRELAKVVQTHLEETKGAIRAIREKLVKELRARKERGELSEDACAREQKRLQDDVQAVTDAATARGREKQEEIIHG